MNSLLAKAAVQLPCFLKNAHMEQTNSVFTKSNLIFRNAITGTEKRHSVWNKRFRPNFDVVNELFAFDMFFALISMAV